MYGFECVRQPRSDGGRSSFVALRFVAALALVGTLTACATGPKNPMTIEQRQKMGITELDVVVSPGATIWWGEAERDFAEIQGCEADTGDKRASAEVGGEEDAAAAAEAPSDCDYDALIESPEARAYMEARAVDVLTGALDEEVVPAFQGTAPARLSVTVRSIRIVSGGQTLLVGGNHVLLAQLQVTDLTSGRILAAYDNMGALSGNAAGGIIGLAVEALSSDPFVRLSENYAEQAKDWLEGDD